MTDAPRVSPDSAPRRPRAGRWFSARRPPAPDGPTVEHVVLPDEPDVSFAGLPALGADFRRRGLDVRLDDRTAGHVVPAAIQALIHQLVEAGYASAQAQHAPGQAVHTRLRIEGGEVVLSAQTFGTAPTASSYAADEQHRAGLHSRVEAAGGRSTIHPTRDGNWLVIIRIPL